MSTEHIPRERITLQVLASTIFADIDIFLLKEPDQVTDKTKQFTVQEIRNQLQITSDKIAIALIRLGYDSHQPLIPSYAPFLDLTVIPNERIIPIED